MNESPRRADQPEPGDTAFWNDVEAVFSDVVELAADAQITVLDRRCPGDTRLRSEVESLLAAHRRAARFMQHPTMPADDEHGRIQRVGDVVGQFKLVDMVAVGGMGIVYRAVRADGAFDQQVAIKIISAPLTREDVRRRFLAERQILASLHHPHIVSLLDAGLTPDGQAFLVMEFVDGVPITTYCRQHALGVADRVRLLRHVCDAVQYAHAHFVVHRDLKPANVLVTADGVPKVLDFGIATLLEGPLAEATSSPASSDPLTPNYASPEQLAGAAVTSASDIYALGMLLFELLTGTRPYDTGGKSLEQVVRMLNDTPTVRPSDASPPLDARPPFDWRRAARGDLDAVALKACHRTADQRYASADALSLDLRRYLDHEPVEARKASLRYVVSKLAERHRIAFLSAGLSAIVVIAALGIALWQARVATVQRQRADRRFSEVRQLAGAVIFTVDGLVAPLPGSTPVRKAIVSEGLKYLERLAADSSDDPALQAELGRAYLKIGAVQGRPTVANLGDLEGALASFAKAKALLAPLATSSTATADVFGDYIDSIRFASEALSVQGGGIRRAEARAALIEAVEAAERFARTRDGRRFIAAAEFNLALQLERSESLPHWQRVGAIYEALAAEEPDNPSWQRNLALVEKYLGDHFEREHNLQASLVHNQRALEIDQGRVERSPDNRQAQLDIAIDLGNVAHLQLVQGRPREAAELYERSLVMRQQLLSSDPKDVRARDRVAFVQRRLGGVYDRLGERETALQHYRASVEEFEKTGPRMALSKAECAAALSEIGDLERRAGRMREACDASRQSLSMFRTVPESERRTIGTNGSDPLPDVVKSVAQCETDGR